jgi:hypothetical protein
MTTKTILIEGKKRKFYGTGDAPLRFVLDKNETLVVTPVCRASGEDCTPAPEGDPVEIYAQTFGRTVTRSGHEELRRKILAWEFSDYLRSTRSYSPNVKDVEATGRPEDLETFRQLQKFWKSYRYSDRLGNERENVEAIPVLYIPLRQKYGSPAATAQMMSICYALKYNDAAESIVYLSAITVQSWTQRESEQVGRIPGELPRRGSQTESRSLSSRSSLRTLVNGNWIPSPDFASVEYNHQAYVIPVKARGIIEVLYCNALNNRNLPLAEQTILRDADGKDRDAQRLLDTQASLHDGNGIRDCFRGHIPTFRALIEHPQRSRDAYRLRLT